jgi:hypothetical protein
LTAPRCALSPEEHPPAELVRLGTSVTCPTMPNRLRREAAVAVADPEDVAEAARVPKEMDAIAVAFKV